MNLTSSLPRVAALLLCSVAAGCAVGPNYTAPTTAVPATFVEGDGSSLGVVANRAWWQDFRDPMLNTLVARGLAQNLDVMAANERINAAEAALRQTGLNAQLSGGASAERTRSSNDARIVSNNGAASLSANYVFDLFGGVRRGQEAATAGYVGAQDNAEATRLAWLAEIVSAYTQARYYQEAIALTRATITARAKTTEISQAKLQLGDSTELDSAQAEALLATAQASLPLLEAGFNAQVYAMATLLNEPAGPLLSQMQRGARQPSPPAGSRTGIPADLLRNRPDIRSAEQSYKAAVANVGVAEAAMYPSLTISGSISDNNSAQGWSFGPQISLPLLNQGALSANRDAKISAAKLAEISWRAAVSSAVEDVQTAQTYVTRYRRNVYSLQKAADAYNRSVGLARTSYEAGATSLLDLLDADRSASSAQLSVAAGRRDLALQWASLQIATGAGATVGAAPK
ncbi:efflux transporter outer membrane subunit [Phaeovulum sp. W22_SRMD_FR3]|uniref:efflux transporter outer membrane subunit n=1 Tax=Phaeovulum sp. W22_SRMD_FR3 TaxID=3240274 RepID=UPI003F9477FA